MELLQRLIKNFISIGFEFELIVDLWTEVQKCFYA